MARQWLARGNVQECGAAGMLAISDAIALAVDLALATPSASGATAFDRLARNRGSADTCETVALKALQQARFRLFKIEMPVSKGVFRGQDLATGEILHLLQDDISAGTADSTVIGRLAPLGEGRFVFAGPVTPLDKAALAIAESFVRSDGSGLGNALRCAEAVYRRIARHGTPPTPGFDRPQSGASRDGDHPFGPDDSELDALAYAWSERGGASPRPEDVQRARELTGLSSILDGLISVLMARDAKRDGLAEAYRQIVLVQLETLQRRGTAGVSATLELDAVAASVDRAIAQRQAPAQVRSLFDELRRHVRMAASGRHRHSSAELDKLIGRIQALRAKTIEQGCTEQEALAAASKVAELLDRHGLSMSELDLRRQDCEGIGVDTDRRRVGPVDECVPAIAAFFDCRAWAEKTQAGTLRHIFFGMPGDVEAAHYLYDLVDTAFDTETARFRASDIYGDIHSRDRRSATTSFHTGLGSGIRAKLHDLRQAREAVRRNGSGRDLMVVKESIVDDEVARLGLSLRARSRATKKYVLTDAYEAGHQAGKRFEYRPGLKEPQPTTYA